jgi:hypothetical protein
MHAQHYTICKLGSKVKKEKKACNKNNITKNSEHSRKQLLFLKTQNNNT